MAKVQATTANDGSSVFDVNTNDPNQLKWQADAMMFVSDLQVNQTLKQQWTSLLASMKAKLDDSPPPADDKDAIYKEKIKIINNFLAQKGYQTAAVFVLELTKTDFYNDHLKESEPNDESDRFVQDILAKPALLAGWQKAMQTAHDSDSTAPDQYLKNNGYRCSAQQVAASFKSMRNVDLKFWTGVYGNTVITTTDGKSETGPTVLIYSSTDGISIGSDMLDKELNKVTYDKGVLSWTKDDFTISHSGQLTFSQVTRAAKDDKDGYVGNEFFGTITYYENGAETKKNIFGRIGKPPVDNSGSGGGDRKKCPTPPSVKLSEVDKAMKYIGYFMAAVFIVDFIASVPKRFKAISEFVEKVKSAVTDDKKSNMEEELDDSFEMIEVSSDEQSLNENGSFDSNVDGAQPENYDNAQGLDGISDEQLPRAEDVQAMEQGLDNINENGEIEQNEDNVNEQDDAVQDDDAYNGESEGEFEGLSDLFKEI
ncbi:hypothetical protein PaecuDRAFT_2820 [Paenibacillus curdlanolyticus YK9]|uniref:Uncharacterized protein n=2 Tax=Paenibacillus curdlanolyticus YK9 TaxID=717606 RepID=E0IB93_9BACL|nr:hypothetical protein [Paenibacillus curdlanolyticus]EFM10384.1 hypothetical protein PaecuDRAFT_2820 [Paenibacillus curdlanolyticus YK9]